MNIDKYKIIVQDEFNLKLSIAVPKGRNPKTGLVADEDKDKLLGYFGTLSGALQKIVNEELRGTISKSKVKVPNDIINALSELSDKLDLKYGNRQILKDNIGKEL